jgi:O-antigen/teichoic acid export membrane protein
MSSKATISHFFGDETARLRQRLRSFFRPDTHTEKGRSLDRYRRVLWSGLAYGASTIATTLVGLISLPLTVRYLGAERYGLWVAIGSWISVFALTDLGVGNSLVNALAEANGKNDREAARKYLSTSVIFIVGVAVCLGIIFFLINPAIAWDRYFNVKTELAIAEVSPTVILVVVFFLLNLPLGVALRAYPAYQESYVAQIWQVVASVAGLGAVILTTTLRLGLPFLAFGLLFSRFFVSATNLAVLLIRSKPWLRPKLRYFDWKSLRWLLKTGILYVLANVGFLLMLQAPYIVGPHAVGLEALGEFGVSHRLYTMLVVLPLMFTSSLWPAYGEAIARGDREWVRNTLVRSYYVGLGIAIPLVVVSVLLGGPIIKRWISPSYEPDRVLLMWLGLWLVTRVWQDIHTQLLNGMDRILGQATYGAASGVAELCFAYLLGTYFGAVGLASGWVIGYVMFSGWLLPLDTWRAIRRFQTGFVPSGQAIELPREGDV